MMKPSREVPGLAFWERTRIFNMLAVSHSLSPTGQILLSETMTPLCFSAFPSPGPSGWTAQKVTAHAL